MFLPVHADCEEKIEIPIRFHNNGWFPITDASVRVNVSNTLDGEKESYDINLRAPAKTSVTVPFPIVTLTFFL